MAFSKMHLCRRTITLFVVLTLCLGSVTALLPLRLRGSQLLKSNGQRVNLKGVNYFGFNNNGEMVNGLWGNDPLGADFATVVRRMRALGFNAVRLPFSFKDLAISPARSFTFDCALPTAVQVGASVTPPGRAPFAAAELPSPPRRAPGKCNDYLPSSSVWDRFIWVVKFFVDNNFYVMIDNHAREDQTFLTDTDGWVRGWSRLAGALNRDPSIRGRVIFDILNEPDQFGVRWEGSNGKPALKDLYVRAMDAIEAVAPNAIFAIEGTGQGNLGANWGDGFATDAGLLSSDKSLSDPRPFFDALLSKPYRNRVILSPHVYPPSVTFNNNADQAGSGLFRRLSLSFGTKSKSGYCSAKKDCVRFPIAVGEFGSKFEESRDLVSMKDIARYFNNQGGGNDGKHDKITNWFYWSWNPNSGDTGGLVDDGWVNVLFKNKIAYLETTGLRPKYLSQRAAVAAVVELPEPVMVSCRARVVVQTPWKQADGSFATAISVHVTNTGNFTVQVPWDMEILSSDGAYTTVKDAWNWEPSLRYDVVQGFVKQPWQDLKPDANDVSAGVIVAGWVSSLSPSAVRINSAECETIIEEE